jgi:Nucleotide-diphospho-sugar transferase
VFLDGDVYLTGTVDPFKNMLPLSNNTWDIQFQPDHPPGTDYNIGWYFARSSPATFDFFNRSYAKWNETHQWDQEVMNAVGKPMELEEHTLRVRNVELDRFKV